MPLSISGDGSRPDSSALMLDRSSLSPRISIRYWAIFFCWGTLQWFSMDRMTGYLRDNCTEQIKVTRLKGRKGQVEWQFHLSENLYEWLCVAEFITVTLYNIQLTPNLHYMADYAFLHSNKTRCQSRQMYNVFLVWWIKLTGGRDINSSGLQTDFFQCCAKHQMWFYWIIWICYTVRSILVCI